MKKVLVTGGTGFIGQHTLAPLLARGFEVHVVTMRAPFIPHKNICIHEIDLLDCTTHELLMQKIRPSHLLHSAWYTQHGKFWEAIENVFWLKATISLAQAFYAQGGKRFLGVGTCAEYNWQDAICKEDETLEIPATLYGKTKKSAFECVRALAEISKESIAWARIFFPYGEGEAKQRLIPYVILNLLNDQPALCTHGNQSRDYLHVKDIGDALATILDSEVSGAINIGSGNSMTIKEIINRIAFLLQKPDLIHFGAIPEPQHSAPFIVADIGRLRTLNWMPKFSLDEGLLRTIAWWKQTNLEGVKNENGN